jgi:hypothetical protein
MPSIRIISIAAVALFTLVLVGMFALRDARRDRLATAAPVPSVSEPEIRTETVDTIEVARLRGEVVALREAVQALRADQRVLGEEIATLDTPTAPAESTSPAAEDATVDPDAYAAEERAWLRAETERLEDRLALDRPDPSFADHAKREIERGLYEHELEGTRVLASQCGSEICRLELASEDAFEMTLLIGAIPELVPAEGGTWWFGDEETGRLTVFSER